MVSNSVHKNVQGEGPVRNQRQEVPKTVQQWQQQSKGLSEVAKDESKGKGNREEDKCEAGVSGEARWGLDNHFRAELPDLANKNTDVLYFISTLILEGTLRGH